MKLSSLFAAAAVSSLLLAGQAFAQAQAPAKTDTMAPAAATEKKAPKARSAESVECSKEADAKGLHGKERKKFRSDCIKNAKAGEKAK
jgi:psiF repeat